MAKDANRGMAIAVLGIVFVVAIVALILLLQGGKGATGKAGDEQPYAKALGGKRVNTFQCPSTCGGKRGAQESVTCEVMPTLANRPANLEWDACAGKTPSGKECWCPAQRPLAA